MEQERLPKGLFRQESPPETARENSKLELHPANLSGHYQNLATLFSQVCQRYAIHPAVSHRNNTLSYERLEELASAFAAFLQNKTALNTGDRIAIQLPNCLQFPVVFFGSILAGMIVVPLNPRQSPRELEKHLNDSGAKAAVVIADNRCKLEEILEFTGVRQIFITGNGDLAGGLKGMVNNGKDWLLHDILQSYRWSPTTSLNRALHIGKRLDLQQNTVDTDNIAMLQYTGGTSGALRAAMLSHQNVIANIIQIQHRLGTHLEENRETLLNALPLHHIYPFVLSFGVFFEKGTHLILLDDGSNTSAMLKALDNRPFTTFVGVESLFARLCADKRFQQRDFSNLKLTSSGGTALHRTTANQWRKITGCQINEGYGLTETCSAVAFSPVDAIRPGTVGLPLPLTRLKVVSNEGKSLTTGEVGELWIKGPQVCKGYWMQPEMTQQVLSEDGWLKTGDLAIIQNDGYLRIIDRKQDVMRVKGFEVFPKDIETVVNDHPKIVESAAVAYKGADNATGIKIYAVSAQGDIDERQLLEYCQSRLTAYKVPTAVEFRDYLPKSSVGKLLRRELREREA